MDICSFKHHQRLITSASFKRAFLSGRKVRCSSFSCFTIANGFDYGRLGIVIAKRNVKLAVQRNRIKRITRELFRHNSDMVRGMDIVVIAYKGADLLDNGEIVKCLKIFLTKSLRLPEK